MHFIVDLAIVKILSVSESVLGFIRLSSKLFKETNVAALKLIKHVIGRYDKDKVEPYADGVIAVSTLEVNSARKQ